MNIVTNEYELVLTIFTLKNDLILRIFHYFMNWVTFSGFTITQTIMKDGSCKIHT